MRRLSAAVALALCLSLFATGASAAPQTLGPQAAQFAGQWLASQVNSIVISTGKSNDVISFNSLANGGNENFAENFNVLSSAGVDLVHLADGHDVTLNGVGHALAVATDGTATLDGQVLNWNNPNPGGGGGSGGSGPVPGVAEDPYAIGPSGLRRLTRTEYDNALRDLLGDPTRPGFAKLMNGLGAKIEAA